VFGVSEQQSLLFGLVRSCEITQNQDQLSKVILVVLWGQNSVAKSVWMSGNLDSGIPMNPIRFTIIDTWMTFGYICPTLI